MMENQRLVLFILFTFSVFMLYESWQRETRPPVQPAPVAIAPAGSSGAAVPTPTQPISAAPSPSATAAAQPAPVGALQKGDVVRVETDLYIAEKVTARCHRRRGVLPVEPGMKHRSNYWLGN